MNIKKTIAALLSVCMSGSALCSFTVNAEDDGPGRKFDTWQDAYWQFLNEFEEGKENDEIREFGIMYEIMDITNDGIPELFISEGAYPLSGVSVYTYKNGYGQYLMSGGGNGLIGYNNDKSHEGVYFITSFMHQGMTIYDVYIYNNGGISPLANFKSDEMYANELNPARYEFNGQEVTREEYYKEFEKYENLDIKYLGRQKYFDERYTTIDNVVYHNYFDHYEVTGAKNDIKNMTIMSVIDGLNVTKVRDYAFQNHKQLETVQFGNKIERIGNNAFEGCTALKSVTIPENVKDIGEQSFFKCSSLKEATILNPECSIWDFWEGGHPLTFCNFVDENGNAVFNGTIKGKYKSTAEKYADIFKLKFDYDKIYYGDVDADERINAVDASKILRAYAQIASTGENTVFDKYQMLAGDVNRDGLVDARDASAVIAYYAKISVGYNGTIEEFMNSGYSFDKYVYGKFNSGLESDKEALEFLDGKWEMMPHGNPLNIRETAVDMSVKAETGEIYFNRGTENALGTVEIQQLFGMPRGFYNLMKVGINYTTNDFSRNSPVDAIFDGYTDYQFFGAYVDGRKRIAVRDVSGGISALNSELGEDNKAKNDFWIFADSNDDGIKVSEEDNERMKLKDKSFYAFRWFDRGDYVYLQEMTTAETILEGEAMGNTGKFNIILYHYPNSGHAMTAVEYKIKGGELLANTGAYKPAMVKVTTDENGDVTEIKELEYFTMGYYFSDHQ